MYILFENSYTFHNFSLNLPPQKKNCPLGKLLYTVITPISGNRGNFKLRSEGGKIGVKVGRSEGGKVGRSEGVKVGRSEGGKVGRSEGGKVGKSEGGKVGRSKD